MRRQYCFNWHIMREAFKEMYLFTYRIHTYCSYYTVPLKLWRTGPEESTSPVEMRYPERHEEALLFQMEHNERGGSADWLETWRIPSASSPLGTYSLNPPYIEPVQYSPSPAALRLFVSFRRDRAINNSTASISHPRSGLLSTASCHGGAFL